MRGKQLYTVIVLAAGQGTRMRAQCSKPFLLLHGEPILLHTLRCFIFHTSIVSIIIVTRPHEIELALQYAPQLPSRLNFRVVSGGCSRRASVAAALAVVETPWVLVHDAVRPFVSKGVLNRLLAVVPKREAVSLGVPAVDTVKEVDQQGRVTYTLPRSKLRMVQTPQLFSTKLLRRAHAANGTSLFTDDASLVEVLGEPVHIIEGDPWNIKLTVPSDLPLAEMMLPIFRSRKEGL